MNSDEKGMKVENEGRRDFLRKSAYVAPAILTMQAYSAAAKAGSGDPCEPPPPPPPRKRPRR
jgi:hypothetical protein